MNLPALAKGRMCQIRVPNQCLASTETVVLCHYRITGLSGMSLKSPDWCAAYGCFRCHDIVDGRAGSWVEFPKWSRDLMLLEGVVRTQAILFEEGVLRVAASKSEAERVG